VTSIKLDIWIVLPPDDDPSGQLEQPETNANDTHALKQLFDAASNLGLDQTTLNDLLAHSASNSS
jgi:serine/arginine repetitive matrix protein 2